MTQSNRKYSPGFKAEAIKLSERTTVAKAAVKIFLSPSQIYDWRKTMMRDYSLMQMENEITLMRKGFNDATTVCNTRI